MAGERLDIVRALLREIAPRHSHIAPIPGTHDLGFGGAGLDIEEYLNLLSRVEDRFGYGFTANGIWPHTLVELALGPSTAPDQEETKQR